MTYISNLDRRSFLIGSASAVGGLSVGFHITLGDEAAAAETAPEVNAWVVIRPDETVVIRIARSEMGQGTLTGLAQLVAEELECDWSKVTYEFPTPGAPSGPCFLPEQPIPEGFDYERWLGPAPWAPYNEGRVSGSYGGVGWRIFEDYSGGQTTDWGAHKFGGAVFALQVDRTSPVEVIVEGKGATMIYANGIRIHHKQGRDMTYKGSAGEVNHGNQANFKTDYFIPNYKGGKRSIYGDFVHCVRSRERCFQDFEVAHRTATVCHLANLCYRFGRGFKFDPVKEEVIGDAEINRWMDRPKRTPWRR